jgi:hypothetical protein
MSIFKRLFKRRINDNKYPLRDLPTPGSEESQKISSKSQQTFIAHDVSDSTIIQYVEMKNFAGTIVDEKIAEELDILCKSRFYAEKNASRGALTLATQIIEGDFVGSSGEIKSRALAWCSRIISISDIVQAEVFLDIAKRVGSNQEIEIAEAFINYQKGQKQIALSSLAALDSSNSRSAALVIISINEGPQVAVDWMTDIGITIADLSSEGKYRLISLYIQLSNWDRVNHCIKEVTEDDVQETPVLNQIMAISSLINAVPLENRPYVINQVPFNASSFRLAADTEGLKARRIAHHYFLMASKQAEQFDCLQSAKVFEEFTIWLEIRDPVESEHGKKRLESKFRNPRTSLRFIYLGLQFGMKIDLEAVELEIDRQITLNGGVTYDTAIARFALAFTKGTALNNANYIAKHREGLSKYIDRKYMLFLQIEMYSEAGMPEKANESLEQLKLEGLSTSDEMHLHRIITDINGRNPLEILKEQYNKTDSLADLHALVEEIESRGEWDELIHYSEIMFTRTKSLRDAETLANALNRSNKNEVLLEFLSTNSDLISQSKQLHLLYCWSLYIQGDLLEARSKYEGIIEDHENPNYRALLVNLLIALGEWDSLNSFVANEYLKKEYRSAQELLGTAQLALKLKSPIAKELIVSAVAKGSDDASILSTAYFMATRAGWENNEETSQWLQKAAAISGENGPIKQVSLNDLITMKPDWDRRETETLHQYNRGELPMFLAAESLNKTLIEVMLLPAYANSTESDPRRRIGLPAYSGIRKESVQIVGSTLAIDATALLTLGLLGVLGDVMDAFSLIYLSHSTMHWIFEEKQKTSFHQPSRIKDASNIQHMYAIEVLEKVIPSTAPLNDLSGLIDDELAMLITEAQMSNVPSLVIRPYPVYQISSFMQNEVDLSQYSGVLSGCLAIVDVLRNYGQLTSDEYAKARSYLHFQEKPWPTQPEVKVGMTLFLDSLAVNYFLHLGLLERLKTAGFRLFVTSRELTEANNLVSYSNLSDKIESVIESIRSTVSSRIKSGKVRIGERRVIADLDEKSNNIQPTVDFLLLAKYCDFLVVDDRFINQHASVAEFDSSKPIITSLDIINWLERSNLISSNQYFEFMTKLRRAGYFYIPVTATELAYHLKGSIVKEEVLIETAELKAIRENIIRVRMSNWIQVPKEEFWLDQLFKTFIKVLKGLWNEKDEMVSIIAKSNWIISQIDVLGWVHCFGDEVGINIINYGRQDYIMLLLVAPNDISSEIREEYWNWIEERVLIPIQVEAPDLYLLIVDRFRKMITDLIDSKISASEAII